MTVKRLWFALFLFPLFIQSHMMVASKPLPTDTTAYQDAVVYDGPSPTYLQVNLLHPGVPAQIVERNRVGTWVRVQRRDDKGKVVMDGWVVSGYLNLSPDLQFSQIPVNSDVSDADTDYVDSQSLKQLYSFPVIPSVSPALRQVYEYGQQLGNQSQSVTKVGDSLTANPMYLTPMSRGDAQLGAYDYLADTIAYFSDSMTVEDVAARIGLTTYTIFDPFWANKNVCQRGETPLDCDYRIKRPSIALIMFGPNDVMHMNTDAFGTQIEMIVQQSLDKGIIPVVSTFSYDPEAELWWQSVNFNLKLAEIAAQYDIPLVNLWAAARILPNYGLDADHVHLKNSGFEYLKFTNGNEAFYGVTLQNLLSLAILDELRRMIIEPESS